MKHSFVAGMMYVHDEDVITISTNRDVECERCKLLLTPRQTVSTRIEFAESECGTVTSVDQRWHAVLDDTK